MSARLITYVAANVMALVGVFLLLWSPSPSLSDLQYFDARITTLDILEPSKENTGDGLYFRVNGNVRRYFLPRLSTTRATETRETLESLKGMRVRMGFVPEDNRVLFLQWHGMPGALRGAQLPEKPQPHTWWGMELLLGALALVALGRRIWL